MPVTARSRLLWCAVAVFAAGCTHQVDGTATGPAGGFRTPLAAVNVDELLLEPSRMRAITGAGDDLTIIPTMDGTTPVDIDALAATAPPQCRFIFKETQTFGPDVERFHKTTFQNPPNGGLISEGAASYRDFDTARHAFDSLVGLVKGCDKTSLGPTFVGDWTADADTLRTRPGACGRDYRVKSVVVIEVTFCSFPQSVPDIVVTNIAANVPG
jgi:hypothetical protein